MGTPRCRRATIVAPAAEAPQAADGERREKERLLRKAYHLALRAHRSAPLDVGPIHVIGRVYAALDMHAQATTAFTLARTVTADADPAILVSAGYLAL